MFQVYKKLNKELKKKIKSNKCKLGIAFGGGGARGVAHLGVLKAFEENGISFDEVAGTSAGSLVGALYAYGVSVDEMYQMAKRIDPSEVRNSKIPLVPSKSDGLINLIKNNIGDVHFEDMKKSLTVVAVDMYTGQEIHIREGSVAKAVAGSCSVPVVFRPVEFDKYLLADGGLQNNIPADVVRNMGCKYVISVDVNPTRGNGTKSTKLVDQISACIGIAIKANCLKGELFSDIMIKPNLSKFKSTSLDGMDEMIEIAYQETMKLMPEIKRLLNIEKPRRFFKFFNRNKDKILKESKLESVEFNKNEPNTKETNKKA